ncbi:MAG: hypothetical protein KIT08_09090 [Anaerolineales bacterium]|nr:MAG: hypothetical protein KIT08_09090 [Anaerolineales bacterium]
MEKDTVVLGDLGQIAHNCWNTIPAHFLSVSLDEFIVMSNHVHGILLINGDSKTKVGAQHAAPLRQDRLQVTPGSLGAIVRSYKSAVTRLIREKLSRPDFVVWQRNYYERVIRNQQELEQTRFYIHHNAVERD